MGGYRKDRRIIGVDGEGAGKDRRGRQHYMLFRIGDRELFTGKPLGPDELFEFILATPAAPALYAYSFGYDATQILRQLPPELFKNGKTGIFDPLPPDFPGQVYYTHYLGKYGIEYIPNNHLRLTRLVPFTRPNGTVGLRSDNHTTRTIYDAFMNFRRPFIRALEQYDVGRKHWPALIAMKAKRAGFDKITQEIRDYCALECELIAELIERLRTQSHDIGLRPVSFNGGGKFASYLHKKHKTPKRIHFQAAFRPALAPIFSNACFGHRFETPCVGEISGPIYEYDQNSAYPHAMRGLPCVDWKHGNPVINPVWHMADGPALAKATEAGELFIANVSFSHPPGTTLCALPVRNEGGNISWPMTGEGTYWSDELRPARRLGCEVTLHHGLIYRPHCDCHTFDWVEQYYDQRKQLGDAGEPLKIALAALTGKFAQHRFGIGTYHNMMYASLITARERGAMLDVIRHDPEAVVMIAGDGVYSRRPLPVEIGEGLGQWKQAALHPSLFIAKPGLYWTPDKLRSKGISTSVFVAYRQAMVKAWRDWCRMFGIGSPHPAIRIKLEMFTGLRMAVESGHPETAGRWYVENEGKGRLIGMSPHNRLPTGLDNFTLTTRPFEGGNASADYSPAQSIEFELERLMFEEQQDDIDLSPP